jgi:hypothetical protein
LGAAKQSITSRKEEWIASSLRFSRRGSGILSGVTTVQAGAHRRVPYAADHVFLRKA